MTAMAEHIFKNNVFDHYKWPAKLIQEPNELEAYFNELQLVGRTIVSARFVGFDFRSSSPYGDHPAKTYSSESAEIDESFILILDDGRRIEINYSDGSTFHISQNSIPLDIKSYQGEEPIDGDLFFRKILGASIDRIVVGRTNIEPDFTGAFGLCLNEDGKQKEFINGVSIEMSNGYRIFFENFIDYGEIWIEKIGETKMPIKWEDSVRSLKPKEKKKLSFPIVKMETCKVLYDVWEMQCCGEPFKVGSRIEWLGAKITDKYLPDYKDMVDYHHQRHYCYELMSEIKGVVKSITVHYCTFKEVNKMMIQDEEKFVKLDSVDGHTEVTDGEWEAVDYIVELENVTAQETGKRLC